MKRLFILLTALTICGLIGCDQSGSDDSTTRQPAVPAQKIAGMTLTNLFNNPTDGTVNLSNIELTDDNIEITIDKALTVTGSNTNLNNALIRITTDGVSLDNINNISVIVEKSVGNGSTKITSSSLSSLTIYGGGMHTIDISGTKIENTTLAKTHESDKDQFVRLLCNDATKFTKSLNVQQSSLLYSEGQNKFNGAKLNIIGKGVTLGSNKEFDKLSNDYAAVTVTDEESQKQFISVVAKDSTLDQAFFVDAIEKTFESVPTQIIKEGSKEPIDFTNTVTGQDNQYIVPLRTSNFTVTYDKDKPNGQRYTLTDTKKNKSKVLDLTDDTNDRSFHCITDDMGNVYFTLKSGSDINLIEINYPQACKLIDNNKDGTWLSAKLFSAVNANDNTYTDNYVIKLAIYRKGINRHLYLLSKKLWSAKDIVGTQYQVGFQVIRLFNLTDTNYNYNTPNITSPGYYQLAIEEIPDLESKTRSTFDFYSQGIAVDSEENLYLDINRFDTTTDTTAGTITFDCAKSCVIRKYTPNITDSTFSLTKAEDKPYGSLGITTDYTYPNTIESSPISLADITAAYTFGVTDMRYDGEDVVIEYCDNDGQTKTVNY